MASMMEAALVPGRVIVLQAVKLPVDEPVLPPIFWTGSPFSGQVPSDLSREDALEHPPV
jgi:hypothetical protein